MLRFQPNVRIGYFSPQAGAVLEAASRWSLGSGVDVDVNHAADGEHSPTSLHPFDCAWDLDTAGDRRADTESLYNYLRVWLPAGYDVVLEGTHVHVEWDTHRRSALTG